MKSIVKNNENNNLWELNTVSMRGSHGDRLKNVSLTIQKGITAIIGPSGAGKSSLLNLLALFEKPDSGRICRGDDTLSLYWVPQGNGLWSHMNVVEHLTAMMNQPDFERIDNILEQFELSHKKTAYPSQMSKGEQSRLAMARALIVPHDILIFDEPLINIAPARELVLWNLVLDIAKQFSTSLIYATHSPKHVLGSAENVICVKDAAILYSGPVETLYHSPPSFELGEYLGDINWFTEDNKMFIQAPSGGVFPMGVRPEQVDLKKSDDGPFKVINSVFRGEITETVIEDIKSGQRINLLHRSAKLLEFGQFLDIVIAWNT